MADLWAISYTEMRISAPINMMMSHSRKSDFLFCKISCRNRMLCCSRRWTLVKKKKAATLDFDLSSCWCIIPPQTSIWSQDWQISESIQIRLEDIPRSAHILHPSKQYLICKAKKKNPTNQCKNKSTSNSNYQ